MNIFEEAEHIVWKADQFAAERERAAMMAACEASLIYEAETQEKAQGYIDRLKARRPGYDWDEVEVKNLVDERTRARFWFVVLVSYSRREQLSEVYIEPWGGGSPYELA